METMPWLVLIFYSVPESILLITISSALYGYDVRYNFKRILLLSVCLAIITFFTRQLELPFNILVELPVFFVLTGLFLKVSFKKSLVIILTGFVIIALAENALNPIITFVTGEELKELFSNEWSRLIIGWCLLIILTIPTLIIIKKQITFKGAIQFFSKSSTSTKFSILFIIVALSQAFLVGVLQLASLYEKSSVWPVAINSDNLQKMIGIALISVPILSIFFLKKIFVQSQQEAEIAAQEAFIENINSLFTTIRAQRHDFINHVHVLYSLLKTNKLNEAEEYMDNLLGDIKEVSDLIKIQNPSLSALFNTKLAIAENHNIVFICDFETSLKGLTIKTIDLVKILGNLVNNALEAVKDQPEEQRLIKVQIKKYSNLFVFTVHNLGPVIPTSQLDKIFTDGFTTKSTENHNGVGLSVVKQLIKKYKGDIGVTSREEKGTTFTVVIPQ